MSRGNGRGGRPGRLLLFDVDGTLVWGGPARECFRVAMDATFGTTGAIATHEFSGKTDPQIARELLRGAGLSDPEIEGGFPELWRRYLAEMERRIATDPPTLLPGVTALLDELAVRPDVRLGLVTGNIAGGARLKLGAVGLHERFEVGGYGSDDERRDRLPAVAVARARRRWGVGFSAERVVVIGDTHRDVACGRAGGHRTVAVATGRVSRRSLLEAGPDHLFEDLADTEEVLEALLR